MIIAPKSLVDLPLELLTKIFELCPTELKSVSRTFYRIENSLFRRKLQDDFGSDIWQCISHDKPIIKQWIKGLDWWRLTLRKIIIAEEEFLDDSWKFIYALYKNRRLYIDYNDYEIQGQGVQVRRSSISNHRHRSNSIVSLESFTSNDEFQFQNKNVLSFNRSIYLTPGVYNFACGLILNSSAVTGLSTTEFSVASSEGIICKYSPPSHLADLVPVGKFCMLDMGNFEVKEPKISKVTEIKDDYDNDSFVHKIQNKLVQLDIKMEEMSNLMKSNFIVCYIDINAYSDQMVEQRGIDLFPKPQPRWLAWWIENQAPKPNNIIDKLLKSVYSSIEESLLKIYEGDKFSTMTESQLFKIDPIDYNKQFYSRVCEGSVVHRVYKWLTIKDRRWNDEMQTQSNINMDQMPLYWKMNSVLDV